MKRIALIVALITVSPFAAGQDVRLEHPNLPASLRAFIDSLDQKSACDLPSEMTVQVESLLQWQFDALTVQTEADELIDVYVRCVPPDRAAPFLIDVHSATESPLARYYLLRGLAATGHRTAVDLLVEQAKNGELYVTVESTHGGGETRHTIGEAASRLLSDLFPAADASSPESWVKWWADTRDHFTTVRGLPYN